MKNIQFNYKVSKIDAVSKYNIYDTSFLPQFNSLIIFSKLNVNDSNFLRDFFFLSKLFFLWFDRKLSILKVISEKKGGSNKGKKSLTFFFGCTLRKYFIFKNLNYIHNIVFNLTKKIDGNIKYKNVNTGLIYSFSNINFLLGFKSDRFNSNLKINIFYKFFLKNTNLFNTKLKYKIVNFYEKVFF